MKRKINKINYRIPIFKPHCSDDEINNVTEVLRSGWWGLGPKTAEFEKLFAKYIGIKYSLALNSATAGLHIAMRLLNIKQGDDILVPAITFISSALAATYCGANPIFVDIELDTLNIDPSDIKRKITENTKAIVVVHFGGHPADMNKILKIAKKHDLYIIEDCAHAMGAYYEEKHVGTFGDIGIFSFHAVKNLATGDGGMLVTNNEKYFKRAKKLRWLGINKDTHERTSLKGYSWYYEVDEIGYKYHMNDIVAALGIAQLKKLEQMNEKRRNIYRFYIENLKDVNWIKPLKIKKNIKTSQHLAIFVLDENINREEFISYLNEYNISAGVHYMPLYYHPIYKNLKKDCPNAEKIWKHIVTLPCYPDITYEEMKYIVEVIKSFRG